MYPLTEEVVVVVEGEIRRVVRLQRPFSVMDVTTVL